MLVLPLEASNSVLVFAADRAVLEHAIAWSRDIDRPNPTGGTDGLLLPGEEHPGQGDFGNHQRRAQRKVGRLHAQRDRWQARASRRRRSWSKSRPTPSRPPAGDLARGKLTLDEPRNALIYQGSATDWGACCR